MCVNAFTVYQEKIEAERSAVEERGGWGVPLLKSEEG